MTEGGDDPRQIKKKEGTRNPEGCRACFVIDRPYYVYIMASKRNGTLYIGVTNDLIRRVYEHKNNLVEGFTDRYRVHKLVYWEQSENIESAIEREKQFKHWKRQWKLGLIEEHNASWEDLYEELF